MCGWVGVTLLLAVFFCLAMHISFWDLSFLTRNQIQATCNGSTEPARGNSLYSLKLQKIVGLLVLASLSLDFPGSSTGKESAYNAGDPGSSLGLGSPLEKRDRLPTPLFLDFSGDVDDKESACSAGGLERSLEGGHGNLLQYSCLDNPYGQRSLVGYSPWDCKELDMIEQPSTAHLYHWKDTFLSTRLCMCAKSFQLCPTL